MKKIVQIFLLIFSISAFSQGEANNWFFGQNAGLNFNSSTPTPITGNLITYEGCASFSDANGDLLFYTDGTKVWNKNGAVMPNGNNLKGDPSSSQSAIIVPHPGNTNLYYIFTVGANNYDNQGNIVKPTEGLHCYIVDITANGGSGDVIGNAIDLSDGKNAQWTEKVTSVKGTECNTFWVISLVNNTFYSYKIDTSGLITSPVISTVNNYANDPRGYLKVSPDGKKLASATYGINSNLLLYSFDDTNGAVANNGEMLLSDSNYIDQAYGVEFSTLSTKLYCSTASYNQPTNDYTYKLYQFDLNSNNITASKTLIHTELGFRGALQLAPNGKIYATIPVNYSLGTPFLDAINAPDELGSACDFETDVINLSPGVAMQGLPPFIASLLLPIEITDNNSNQNINKTTVKRCIGETYSITAENITGNPTYEWTFNNNIVSSTASLNLGSLTSSSAGTYYLTVETTDACGFRITYKGEVTLETYNPPTITKPSNINQCDNDNDGFYTFDLHTLKDSEILNGQDPNEFEVLYFTNQIDADNNTNTILGNYTNNTTYSSNTLIARIQNKNNSICYETTSFVVTVFETPNPPTTISNYTICDSNITGTDTDGIETFNLNSKNSEILNGQSSNNFTITYFTDAALSKPVLTPNNFQNTSNPQTIYAKIVNNNNPNCINSTSFIIEVFQLPTITNYFQFKQCDEDGTNDSFTDFNLTEANTYLTNNNSALTVTYYLNTTDAELGNNSINPYPFSNQTQSTVYARIENENGCYRTAQVDLLVSSTHFPTGYLKTVSTCDLDAINDGISTFILKDNDAAIINQFPSGQNLTVSYYRNLNDVQLEQNKIDKNNPYANEIPENQTIYVRVESEDNGACFGLGPHLQLTVHKRPEFELDSTAIYCQNLNPINVSTYNPKGNYTYQWTDENNNIISSSSDATISSEGKYTVIATSSSYECKSFPHSIQVNPSIIAAISQNDIQIVDDSENNSITINTNNLGIGDYEFALDDSFGNYQDEPVFTNVAPGIHTIYIQDKKGCGIAQIDVSIIGYPKFFTPNNDGVNDTWKILGVNGNFYANSKIFIFDRFGKLITQIDPKGEGWNGVFNGQYLPASDYWFSVELIDKNGNIKIRKGHFSLIRR
jgi:gliding motility-associated-like protein